MMKNRIFLFHYRTISFGWIVLLLFKLKEKHQFQVLTCSSREKNCYCGYCGQILSIPENSKLLLKVR